MWSQVRILQGSPFSRYGFACRYPSVISSVSRSVRHCRPAAGSFWPCRIDRHLDEIVAIHCSGQLDDDDGDAQESDSADDSVAFFHGPLPPTSRESRIIRGSGNYIAFCAKRYMACSRCQSAGCNKQQAAGNAFDPSPPAIAEISAGANRRDSDAEQGIDDPAQADEDNGEKAGL